MTIVLIAHGNGNSPADFVAVKIFDDLTDATNYANSITDKESKYWTTAEIISESTAYEIYGGDFSYSSSNDWLFLK